MTFDEEEWREAVKSLELLCAPPLPVKVTRKRMTGDHYGWCSKEKRKKGEPPHFRVEVRKLSDIHHSLLILVHEWAHAMVWDLAQRREPDHDAHFGVAYARCHRAVFPENL